MEGLREKIKSPFVAFYVYISGFIISQYG